MTVMAHKTAMREIALDDMPGPGAAENLSPAETEAREARPSGKRAAGKALSLGILAALLTWLLYGLLFLVFTGAPVAETLVSAGGLVMLGVALVVESVSFFTRS